LQGLLPPHGCFLVGGPTGVTGNTLASSVQSIDFEPDLPLPGVTAAGVGLFFQDVATLTPDSRPLDLVVYGTHNDRPLVDEHGQAASLDLGPVGDQAVERVAALPRRWEPAAAPSPGACFAVPSTGTLRPSWIGQHGGEVLVQGFGLTPELFTVALGDATLSCQAAAGGLRCLAPPASAPGETALTVTQRRQVVLQDGLPATRELPADQRPSVIVPGALRYDWCRLDAPDLLALIAGQTSAPIGVSLHIPGITEGPTAGSKVLVQLGHGPVDSVPDESWTWTDAAFDPDSPDPVQDRYAAALTMPAQAGTFALYARVSADEGAAWMLCDRGEAGNADGITQPGLLAVESPGDIVIDSFTATPDTVLAGATVTLAWTVRQATSLTLTADGVPLDLGEAGVAAGLLPYAVTADTRFVLTAEDDEGHRATATCAVVVRPPATVAAFTATPDRVCAGGSVRLAWSTTDVVRYTLTDATGRVLDTSGLFGDDLELRLNPLSTTSYTLTVEGAAGDLVSASVTVLVDPIPVIRSFASSRVGSLVSGQSTTLSWQTTWAQRLTLLANDTPVDLGDRPLTSGEILLTPPVSVSYVLTAYNEQCQSLPASIQLAVLPANLQLSEVFRRTTAGGVDGYQWVELHNAGDTVVDLAGYSLGSGQQSYVESTVQLAGQLLPGDCFVVGGPFAVVGNGTPALDQVQDFAPDLPEPEPASAAGIGLFFDKANRLWAGSVPIDAVVYGTANPQKLRGPDGLQSPVHVGPGELPIVRLGSSPTVWGEAAVATPNRCWTLRPSSLGGPLRPTWGPQGGGNSVLIAGFGLRPELHQVIFAASPLACTGNEAGQPSGLLCQVSRSLGLGSADVTVTQHRRPVLQDDQVTVLDLPVEERTSVLLAAAYRYDWCRIQAPAQLTVSAGALSAAVTTRVYAAGLTDVPEAPETLIARVGWGEAGTWPAQSFDDPGTWTEWSPQPLDEAYGQDGQRQFQGGLVAPSQPGDYWFVTQVSADAGDHWMTCDSDGEGNANGLESPGVLRVEP